MSTAPTVSAVGRWNLMVAPDGRAPGAAKIVDAAALRHGWSCVPVVPCDDAAVERVALCHWMREMSWSEHPNHLKSVRDRWDKTTESVRESYRRVAREDLEAARGEEATDAH